MSRPALAPPRLAALAALAVLAVLLAAPALAAALSVNEVAREVRCPTCNTPLDVSSSAVAVNMKQYIADRIERGWTKDEIIAGLVDQFGEGILTTPATSGFDLVAWLVPGIAVAIGLGSIPLLMRAWARRGAGEGGDAEGAQEPVPAPSPDEARRLEEELRRVRGA